MNRSSTSRWDPHVPWKVPRKLTWSPPPDLAWAEQGRKLIVGPGKPSQVIAPEDWVQPTASQICALLFVSAVQARVYTLAGIPTDCLLYSNKPALVRLWRGNRFGVHSCESRTGELWAFPLRYRVGPPRPFTNPPLQP